MSFYSVLSLALSVLLSFALARVGEGKGSRKKD
jgi:hypothetical protein